MSFPPSGSADGRAIGRPGGGSQGMDSMVPAEAGPSAPGTQSHRKRSTQGPKDPSPPEPAASMRAAVPSPGSSGVQGARAPEAGPPPPRRPRPAGCPQAPADKARPQGSSPRMFKEKYTNCYFLRLPGCWGFTSREKADCQTENVASPFVRVTHFWSLNGTGLGGAGRGGPAAARGPPGRGSGGDRVWGAVRGAG